MYASALLCQIDRQVHFLANVFAHFLRIAVCRRKRLKVENAEHVSGRHGFTGVTREQFLCWVHVDASNRLSEVFLAIV